MNTIELIKNDRVLTITSQHCVDELVRLTQSYVHHSTRSRVLRTVATELLSKLGVSVTPLEFSAIVVALQLVVTRADWYGESIGNSLRELAPGVYNQLVQAQATGFPPSVSSFDAAPAAAESLQGTLLTMEEMSDGLKQRFCAEEKGEYLAGLESSKAWLNVASSWTDFVRKISREVHASVSHLDNCLKLYKLQQSCKAANCAKIPTALDHASGLLSIGSYEDKVHVWNAACKLTRGYPSASLLRDVASKYIAEFPQRAHYMSARKKKGIDKMVRTAQFEVVPPINHAVSLTEIDDVLAGIREAFQTTTRDEAIETLSNLKQILSKLSDRQLVEELAEAERRVQQLRAKLQRSA